MVKHSCNKEKEIAEMSTNQRWIMGALKDISPKINEMHDVFIQGEGKIKVINKSLFGNGKPGLIERVEKIEELLAKVEGGKIVVKEMGIFTKWLIGILASGNVIGWLYIIFTRLIK